MKIEVIPNCFDANGEAEQKLELAVKQDGLHPLSMSVPPVRNSSHWHRFSTSLYILEGQLKITDVMLEKTYTAGPGCRVSAGEIVRHFACVGDQGPWARATDAAVIMRDDAKVLGKGGHLTRPKTSDAAKSCDE